MRLKGVLGGGGIALVLVGGAYAQQARWAPADDETAKAMIEMERGWAEENCTGKSVEHTLLADDFQGTSPGGARYTKSQAIREAESPRKPGRDCRLGDVAIHFFGDSIAVAYGSESSIETTKDGSDRKQCLVWTDTWLKRNGTWQIVAAQDMLSDCK